MRPKWGCPAYENPDPIEARASRRALTVPGDKPRGNDFMPNRLALSILSVAFIMFIHILLPSTPVVSDDDTAPAQVKGEDSSVSPDENKATSEQSNTSRLNLALKTGGGTQLWTDHVYRDGYRIQQNALTGHWRLLDADDVRRAWGSRAACQSALDQRHPATSEAESAQHFVILLHGLMRTRHSMKPLEDKLKQEGYPNVIRYSYASTRSSIGDHAAALRELLEQLPESTELSFVGHSMGNIVVRHLIGDLQSGGDPRGILRRCRSMVMLGPPNQGASIARRLAPTGLYGIVTGQGGLELGPKWQEFAKHLVIPPFPFAIVAGDLSKHRFQNPLVDGSGDYIVSVEEARLDGAASFETVPVLHSVLMNDPAVMNLTIDFIKSH